MSRAAAAISLRDETFSELPMRPTRLIFWASFFNQSQEFFVARRSQQRRFRHAAPRQLRLLRHEIFDFTQHPRMDGGVGDDAAAFVGLGFARLKLGFDQRNDSSGCAEQCNRDRKYLTQRNKGAIDHREFERGKWLWKRGGRQVPGVGPFHHDDARIMAQLPGKLAMSDINGINLPRAVLQETIGKAAGRCAEVQCCQAGDIKFEMLQRMFQFETAATDIPFAGGESDLVGRLNFVARLFGWLLIDGDLSSHDGTLGLLAAFAQAPVYQRLI
jgi:hypothetical protein